MALDLQVQPLDEDPSSNGAGDHSLPTSLSSSPAPLDQDEMDPELRQMNYLSLFALFLKFGLLAWGGPMAQIEMLRAHFVDGLRWISKARFNRVLAVYQALPGPEATELACYFGMLSRGRPGSVIAGIGFLLPGFLFMLIVSILYAKYGIQSPVVNKSLTAVQPCVAAMVLRAVHKISESCLIDSELASVVSIPLLLLAIFGALQNVAGINFGITLLFGGLLFACFKAGHRRQQLSSSDSPSNDVEGQDGLELQSMEDAPSRNGSNHGHARAATSRTMPFLSFSLSSPLPWYLLAFVLLVGGVATVVALKYTIGLGWLGAGNSPNGGLIASRELWALFVLGLLAGLLTFGGAYTAIPFVQQDAVIAGHWISADAFLDGIALTQILPTPLVMFSTFVGYMGNGLPGALLMTIGMFLPAFSFTLIGHNFFEHIVKIHSIRDFLDGVTGSVIGLIAVTAAQLIKATVINPLTAIVFGLCLAALYSFKSPWTNPLLVVSAAIMGQALL